QLSSRLKIENEGKDCIAFLRRIALPPGGSTGFIAQRHGESLFRVADDASNESDAIGCCECLPVLPFAGSDLLAHPSPALIGRRGSGGVGELTLSERISSGWKQTNHRDGHVVQEPVRVPLNTLRRGR